MGSPFQQRALRRKIVYIVLIVLLFTATMLFRSYAVEPQGQALALRDTDVGEVELSGRAIQLSLTGLRGWASCILWKFAIDLQMKNKWDELEVAVRSITKLQPHFITPWLFQSWNLAYNVSVESDRVGDKYYYITRGIELLGEGERQNANNPDLRSNLGYYYQDKIGMADEHNTLMSLWNLSNIDPLERRETLFRRAGGDRIEFMEAFEKFCKDHPMLIRRLRETPGKKPDEVICKTPEEIVDFLKANQKVPSRFEEVSDTAGQESSPLKSVNDRFPVLPPPSRFGGNQEITYDSPSSEFRDPFTNFDAARAWFSYAQDPLETGRLPKTPMKIIFQGFPSRAQYYLAEQREKEGWFDEDGWEIKDWFLASTNPDGPKRSVKVGADRPWAIEAWEKAYQMVKERGERTGLIPDARMSDAKKREYLMNRGVTNYDHFLITSRVERTRPAVTARKLFAYADKFDTVGDYDQALPFYEKPDAFGNPSTWTNAKATGWRRILLDNPDYAGEDDVQEDSYVFQHQYKHSVQELNGVFLKQLVVLTDAFTQATKPPAVLSWLPPPQLARRLHAQLVGPLDDLNKQGKPFIGDDAISSARHRLGLFDFASAARQPSPEQRQQMMEQKRQRQMSKMPR
jgi:hypothetical protein